ncbi:hypothetical protein VMUT_1183 [Vulcanisaeta moutnovskia 768-28]|uniref:Uncharacterized protein n=1 Tax=Vulcanisaeta moutnovskia (strain 768-28) TaxID=985053 RepID=F0QYF5_VULM7|nr:hypothetical protein [Vulcanisaeta moutnovskia]ADY01388.1 hypothetical protein VMUT_1183 [Vulcanisaeta moutnovskia 768-28]
MMIISSNRFLLIVTIALIILDAYIMYVHTLGSPLPYIKVLGDLGPYIVVNIHNNDLLLYSGIQKTLYTTEHIYVPEYIISIKNYDILNNRQLWVTNITANTITILMPQFDIINNTLFMLSYGEYSTHPFTEMIINVTVINILTEDVISSTAIASTYYPFTTGIIDNSIYLFTFPLTGKGIMNLTYYRLMDRPPYVIMLWNRTFTDVCGPYSTSGPIDVYVSNNYLLITVPCNTSLRIYLLNKTSGEPIMSTLITINKSIVHVFGLLNNTIIYQCGSQICGLSIINNRTWAIPINGDLISVGIYDNKALVLMFLNNTIWLNTINQDGSLILHKGIWRGLGALNSYCYIDVYQYSAAMFQLTRNTFLITVGPFAFSPYNLNYHCLPVLYVVMNISNGEQMMKLTRLDRSGSIYSIIPSLYIDYVGGHSIIFSLCSGNRCIRYLTTPNALINDWWYYVIFDSQYSIITITIA